MREVYRNVSLGPKLVHGSGAGSGIAWWLFWGAAGILAYTYLAFPLIAGLRAMIRARPVRAGTPLPSVSMIVAAYNEAPIIERKIENTLRLEYPADRLEVIIASDGSTDGTDEIVQRRASDRIRLLALPRQGKNLTLNAAVEAATGEVVVFTDADAELEPETLQHLVRPFGDPEVGGVGGERRHAGYGRRGPAGRLAWRLKRSLRQLLSRAGSMTAAEGQLYAVRRALFTPIPSGACDDFYASVRVVARGRRLVFEPRAAAYPMVGSRQPPAEFRRKVRVVAAWFNAAWLVRGLLDPRHYGFYALQLLSHKLLRRLQVIPLLVLAATAPLLWRRGALYRVANVVQAVLHGVAAIGLLWRASPIGRFPPIRLAATFDLVNAATAVALVEAIRGRRYDIWTPLRGPAAGPSEVAGDRPAGGE